MRERRFFQKATFALLLTLVLASVAGFLLGKKTSRKEASISSIQKGKASNEAAPERTTSLFETKIDDQAAISIEVRPEKLGIEEEQNIFEVSFDTHSVNLDFDFAKIMTLEDNLGGKYQALSWSGAQGGHHLKGKVVFPPLRREAKEVRLFISGVGGVARVFSWRI